MNNEFVPYDIALAMKELGFNEECLQYCKDSSTYIAGNRKAKNSDYPNNNVCAQPLYQQAFRWFRENGKKLDLYDFGVLSNGKYKYYYFYNDGYTKKSNDDFYGGKTWSTYEEAELACLRKLIEIVKEK